MVEYPDAARVHDRDMRRLTLLALRAARSSWAAVSLADLSATGQTYARKLAPVMTRLQEEAATLSAGYSAMVLAQQDTYVAPEAFVNPAAFAGIAPDGRPLGSLLFSPVTQVKTLIGREVAPAKALRMGGDRLDRIVQTVVSDTGRAAAGVDIASRPGVGYVRMLNPPSCDRCAILAGRFYRWNAGFQRHPRCDCRHVPAKESTAGEATVDPYEYFRSLSAEDQDKTFGSAQAQAVRDGADIFQVVNARRGVQPGGLVTKEGTSRRGSYGSGKAPRLTPEAIYARTSDRAEALQLLERYGYVLPGGQDPAGVLRGQREGFGALGRGGTRVGASQAVEQARRTGIRNPGVRATMTEAERRAYDVRSRWEAVQQGRDPFRAGRPLTPEISARVERDYRKYVLGY